MQLDGQQAGGIRSATVLSLSLGLNLVLAGAALYLLKRPPATLLPSASITNLLVVTARARSAEATNLSGSLTYVTNQFHWRQIESTNYDEYVANLRGIGCPERTIRDIILADVEKHYQTRQETLSRDLERFWMGGNQRRVAHRERVASFRSMLQEKKDLIRRLLGIEPPAESDPFRRGRFDEQALIRSLVGPLPEETFRRVIATMDDYYLQANEVHIRAAGIRTDDDDAALKSLGEALKKELSAILTPEQFEELIAREAAYNYFRGWLISDAMELTPAEARQVALAKFRTRDGSQILNPGDAVDDSELALRERQFTNAVASVLGTEHFEKFQRAQDGNYEVLYDLAREHGLPKETAIKIYDIRRLTADEVAKVRQDATLDESTRQQRFEEMATALQREVSALLGAKAYGKYLNYDHYSGWVTNVTRL